MDRLDAMSCCRGDFGLWHRSLAGWVHGGGRLVLGAAELAEPSERRVLLWPFDRAESRGRLVGLALRRAPGEVVLLGLRAAAHWPEGGGGDGAAPPAEARQNVAGLQAEFAARGADGAWADKQLLDFNALTGGAFSRNLMDSIEFKAIGCRPFSPLSPRPSLREHRQATGRTRSRPPRARRRARPRTRC